MTTTRRTTKEQKAAALVAAREAAHLKASRRLVAAMELVAPNTYRIPPGFLAALRVAQAELAIAYQRRVHE